MDASKMFGAEGAYANINLHDVPLPSFTREQREQIKQYADSVLTVLDEIEDAVWDVDEAQVAGIMKTALSKCCEGLEVLKERLPRSDQQRRDLARSYISGIMTPSQSGARERLSNNYADPQGVDEETVLAAAMLPESQREQFLRTMHAAREGLRARMQREWTTETQMQAEHELVERLLLMEAVMDEVKEVFSSVDDEDLEQVAFFGVAFARYVATSARSAVDKAIGMVFDDGSVVVVHAASSSSRFEEIDSEEPAPVEPGCGVGGGGSGGEAAELRAKDGAPDLHRTPAGHTATAPNHSNPKHRNPGSRAGLQAGAEPTSSGHSENSASGNVGRQGRRGGSARKCARTRLLWPSLRKHCMLGIQLGLRHVGVVGGGIWQEEAASTEAEATQPAATRTHTTHSHSPAVTPLFLTAAAVAILALWPVLVALICVMLPVLLVDEVLQVFYDKVAKKWAMTDGIEETFCAFLFALKAWFMVAKISVKQTVRLARRQWARAAERPGGIVVLAKETVFALLEIAFRMAWNVARNPLVLYTKPRDIVVAFWSHVQVVRSRSC